MTLEEMRRRVREGLAGRIGDFSDVDVDAVLNRVWQFEIPAIIDGEGREGEIQFDFEVGKDTYDLDLAADVGADNAGLVRAVRQGIALTNRTWELEYFDSDRQFFTRYRRDDPTTSEPRAVLVRGRELIFRPIPSEALTVAVPASLFRDPIPDPDGVENDDRAMLAVRGAISEIAIEQGYDAVGQTNEKGLQAGLSRFRGQSYARPKATRWRRDF